MIPDDLDRILVFLTSIGMRVEARDLPEDTFMPGVSLDGETLLYDPARLRHPGDLLHEAGHLAVLPSAERAARTEASMDGGMEIGAIAWSYAALVHLGLPAELVFHAEGYKGDSEALRDGFASGRHLGVPILEWRGLTDFQRPGTENSATRYPVMKKWLCD